MTDVGGIAIEVHKNAVTKGFWDGEPDINFILSKIALVHSEASEILEATRKEMGSEAITTEIADLLIRTLDLYQGMFDNGWIIHPIDEILDKKIDQNLKRPHKHGVLA